MNGAMAKNLFLLVNDITQSSVFKNILLNIGSLNKHKTFK